MIITEDVADGSFTAAVKEGETLYVKPHVNIYNEASVYLKYYSKDDGVIIHRSITAKWWWKYFPMNQFEREIEDFLAEGLSKAAKVREQKAKAARLGQFTKDILKGE